MGVHGHQSRSSSLMPVLERVCASTRLDDHGAIEARPGLAVGQRLAGQAARHHHRIGRHPADMDLAGGAVDDLGRGADEDAHREHRAFADDDALDHFGAGADEAIVLDDRRAGLQRLEHAADADAAREVHVLADLGAGADGRPGIDHGALVDIGADVDEARHQHDALADMAPSGGRRRRARRGSRPRGTGSRPSLRTWRAPCPTSWSRRGRRRSRTLSLRRKLQQHGLLQPLVDLPVAVAPLFGDAGLAAVEQLQRLARPPRAPRPWCCEIDLGPRLPGGVDGGVSIDMAEVRAVDKAFPVSVAPLRQSARLGPRPFNRTGPLNADQSLTPLCDAWRINGEAHGQTPAHPAAHLAAGHRRRQARRRRRRRPRLPPIRLAYADEEFLTSDDTRGIRFQLEYMKTEFTPARARHQFDRRAVRRRAHPRAGQGRLGRPQRDAEEEPRSGLAATTTRRGASPSMPR